VVVPVVANLAVLTVIGCGNANRSDDAVGVQLAQRLYHHLTEFPNPRVQVFDAGTAGMEVMFQARGSDRLILIDACNTGSEAGVVFNVPGSELVNCPQPGFNLHDFRWDHALYAGRRIFAGDFPTDVRVYLIEAADLSFGLELSEPVSKAAEMVFTEVRQVVDDYRG
jgi:hydrogenase maturation protease